MEEERKCHERVTIMKRSQGITIKEENPSSSNARKKRNRDESMRIERDRRDKMTEFYSTLRSMVPQLFPKASKEKVVGETITYIRKLELELNRLQEQKAETESIDLQSSSTEVTVSGKVALFGIRAVVMKRTSAAMERVFRVFEEHKAEVLAASVAVKDRTLRLTITALMEGGDGDDEIVVERIKGDLTHALNLLSSEIVY